MCLLVRHTFVDLLGQFVSYFLVAPLVYSIVWTPAGTIFGVSLGVQTFTRATRGQRSAFREGLSASVPLLYPMHIIH